jgi:hypothetical protein
VFDFVDATAAVGERHLATNIVLHERPDGVMAGRCCGLRVGAANTTLTIAHVSCTTTRSCEKVGDGVSGFVPVQDVDPL